jgi:hypothetical protein
MRDIIERLESATGADREIDREIAVQALGWSPPRNAGVCGPNYVKSGDFMWYDREGCARGFEPPAYTASIDAAMTLVPNDCVWGLSKQERGFTGPYYYQASVMPPSGPWADGIVAATPALALCIAALKAREQS